MANHIKIGNTAQRSDSAECPWSWTFYVKPAEYVEEVIVQLHPTFTNPVRKLHGSKLELSMLGWGTFKLDVTVHWRGGGQLHTTWMLQFGDNGDFYKEVEVPPEVMSRLSGSPHYDGASLQESAAQQTTPAWDRASLLAILGSVPELDPGCDEVGKTWHGRLVQEQLPRPKLTWQSQRRPREDKHGKQDVPEWLNASEYKDDTQALNYKVRLLANLLRCSKKSLAYTGAGLSVAAGIEQAAAGSAKAKQSNPLHADPTVAHCIMAQLNRQNLLHGWVQQNHDGLPQKAGYRQEDINEIHGSWYDPSNPVVLYSGSLRGDLFADMKDWAKTADLTLVLGTSLSGLNADQCATKAAQRSLPDRRGRNSSLGSVIISPQRTPEDGQASLRIFATADEVMAALAKEFGLQVPLDARSRRAQFSKELRVKVPYDRNGKRSNKVTTWWDLSPGARLRVSHHNNIQGAEQPAYLHITPQIVGKALRQNDQACCISVLFGDGASSQSMQLGLWWLDAAVRGGVDHLPVVNVDAVEEPVR